MTMNGSCRKATLVTIGSVIAAALLTVIYIWDCHRRGEADYLAISQSREPIHASPGFPIADGGSMVYYGRGYRVKRVRRIIPYQFGDGFGYIVGGELKWNGLARAFLRDEDYIRYIEPLQSGTNHIR